VVTQKNADSYRCLALDSNSRPKRISVNSVTTRARSSCCSHLDQLRSRFIRRRDEPGSPHVSGARTQVWIRSITTHIHVDMMTAFSCLRHAEEELTFRNTLTNNVLLLPTATKVLTFLVNLATSIYVGWGKKIQSTYVIFSLEYSSISPWSTRESHSCIWWSRDPVLLLTDIVEQYRKRIFFSKQ
jgi:hypothetical protein